jgi:hypothetical protein
MGDGFNISFLPQHYDGDCIGTYCQHLAEILKPFPQIESFFDEDPSWVDNEPVDDSLDVHYQNLAQALKGSTTTVYTSFFEDDFLSS